MNKYLASVCWLLITVLSVVQLGSSVFADSTASSMITMHTSMSDITEMTDMAQIDADCVQKPCAKHTAALSHCTDALCMASCASHCMSAATLAVLTSRAPMLKNQFDLMSELKPKSSAIQPSTPPPKSA